MGRIRIVGALLAVVSAVSAVIFARTGLGLPAVLLIAGAIPLALVAPFNAPMPPARRRVALAAAIYAVLVAIAAVATVLVDRGEALAVPVAGQALVGTALAWQAFRTRNRRRRDVGLRAYYHN